MPTIGTTTKPSGGWHAFAGSSETNQEAEELVMPSSVRLTRLGQWIGGWSGTCRTWLVVWDASSMAFLGRTAQINVATAGAGGPAGGNVALYEADLTAPIDLPAGAHVLVGFVRHQDDGHQISTGGSATGPHYHGRSGPTFPDQEFDHGGSGLVEEVVRRIGSYIADYEPRPGAYVRRSGVWVEAQAVYLRRSGAWVEATGVQIRRSGVWQDAD